LKTFIDEELTKHVTMKDELINMLEVKSNEW
jgi:hypothetical protein